MSMTIKVRMTSADGKVHLKLVSGITGSWSQPDPAEGYLIVSEGNIGVDDDKFILNSGALSAGGPVVALHDFSWSAKAGSTGSAECLMCIDASSDWEWEVISVD
jgi:hypothetical protein